MSLGGAASVMSIPWILLLYKKRKRIAEAVSFLILVIVGRRSATLFLRVTLVISLSRLTSLGCGQHLTSEMCFFSQEHTHFGAHTSQLCISVDISKKDFRSAFFSCFEFMAGSVVASA